MEMEERNTPDQGFVPLVTVVGFHHARGPEIESWFGAPEGSDPAVDNEWSLLPFMALSDGAHASTEDFSYFTLLRPAQGGQPATSLFGISCTRQMDAAQLLTRPVDVTRSTVQKAVVVIANSPQQFGMLRERLSVVTTAWFAQREFTDTEILRRFQESLREESEREGAQEDDKDEYLGMSLRELVREFKWQTLVLFKCCLLQPKMLFFGSRCERLCMMQFSLISLIPGLIRNLQDCADPELDSYVQNLVKPTSLRTSDRNSLLSYMGLPLQIFGKGSLFGPYTPLQQLDLLADYGTKSYIVGSTNSLLLQQKDRYSDILINLDDDTISITSSSLRSALSLSAADRRWIDFITQAVNDTWDESNPGRPKTMGYVGSEEFIRLQFEEYLLSLISSVKCHNYILHNAQNPRAMLPNVESDPAYDFGIDWIDAWSRSENYLTWEKVTDSHLFDIVEPKHPCAGGLTIDDVQRRIAEQVKEFHLDERFAVGKEVIGRNLMAGREKASTVFSKLYSDMEALRESQRRKHEEQKREAEANNPPISPAYNQNGVKQTVSSKAGSYIGSWGAWVGEKRKTGWGKSTLGTKKEGFHSSAPTTPIRFPDEKPTASVTSVTLMDATRPSSYQENIFDAESNRQSKRISTQHAVPSKFHEILDESPIDARVETPVTSVPTPPTKVSELEPVLEPEPVPELAAARLSEPEPAPTPESRPAEESVTPTTASIPDPDPLPPTGWSETSTPITATEKNPSDVAEAVAEAVKATSAEAVSPWYNQSHTSLA